METPSPTPAHTGVRKNATCKICGSNAPQVFALPSTKVTGMPMPHTENDCSYYQCSSCQFVFADALDQKPPESIYNEDYWSKQDPDWHRRVTETMRLVMLASQFSRRSLWELDILDFGCGLGYSVETFRRLDLRCWGTDVVTPKFGAEYYLRDLRERKFDIIVACEVVEHFTDPLGQLRHIVSLLNPHGVFAFQTAEYDAKMGRDWWYVGPANGHVSLFSRGAFDYLYRSLGARDRVMWHGYPGIQAWEFGRWKIHIPARQLRVLREETRRGESIVFRQSPATSPDSIVFGPYLTVPAGEYEVVIDAEVDGEFAVKLVSADEVEHRIFQMNDRSLITRLSLPRAVGGFEIIVRPTELSRSLNLKGVTLTQAPHR